MNNRDKLRHLTAVLILGMVVLIRWWPYLGSATDLGDEGIYLQAFEAVAAGGSATSVSGFYYPPVSASFGAIVLRSIGVTATRTLLRVGSVVGLAISVWVALGLWPTSWWRRLAVGCGYVALAPAVHYGIAAGNVSFLVCGAILLALLIWARRPITSGFLLGASVGIKPLAPLAIVALVLHRPIPPSNRQWLAGGVAGLLAAGLLLAHPDYLLTTAGSVERLPFIRSISLNRILTLLDLAVSPIVVAGVLAVAVACVVRLVPMTRQELLCLGGVAAVQAAPIIWSHTLLLTLPAQVLALDLAYRRLRQWPQPTGERAEAAIEVWRRYEWVFVMLAVAALQLTEGAGAIDDQNLIFQLFILTGAYLTAPILMFYILAASRQQSGGLQPVGRPSGFVEERVVS